MAKKVHSIDPRSLATNPRCTLSNWLRFAPVISEARAAFPKPYRYSNPALSPATIANNIRDVIRAAICFSFVEDVDALSSWFDSVVIRRCESDVFIGPPDALDSAQPLSTTSTLSTVTLEQLSALCLLLSSSILTGPYHVRTPPVSIDLLPQYPNCEIIHNADGSLTLL